MAKLKIGDIVEINTKFGFAYVQYTHNHKKYGSLLRVLKGFFESRPSDLISLAAQVTQFVTFLPLAAATKRGIFSIIGNAPIPEFARQFPVFRCGVSAPGTNKISIWWLWDGEKEWKVGELVPEQLMLPIRGVWNDTLLIERIEEGWLPEKEGK